MALQSLATASFPNYCESANPTVVSGMAKLAVFPCLIGSSRCERARSIFPLFWTLFNTRWQGLNLALVFPTIVATIPTNLLKVAMFWWWKPFVYEFMVCLLT